MSTQHISFIHCADLHLDSRMESHLTPFQAQNRRKELLQTFSRMADYAEVHDIRAILMPGDLFDTTHPSFSAIETVLNCIREHPQIDFLYLPGNHDYQIRAPFSLNTGCPDNLWLFWSEKADFQNFPDSFLHHMVMQKNYGPVIITGLTGSTSQLPELSASHINLVMLHGQIHSHTVSLESDTDHALHYSLNDLSGRNIDYIAAGHIHQYQFGPIDSRGHYCYSGCLEGRGFDECGEKGFVLLDVSTDSEETSPISFQFVPFAARYLYDLNLDLTDYTDYQDVWRQIDQLFSTIDHTHLVRLKLTGRIPLELNLHTDWLLQKYFDDFYLLYVEDCTKPAISYEDYRYDISLKGEFIRLVLSASDLNEEEKEKVIMEGLHALAGEEVRLG